MITLWFANIMWHSSPLCFQECSLVTGLKPYFYICTPQSYIASECCLVNAQLVKIRPKDSPYFILEQKRIEYRRAGTE